ncbi:MAG: DEAD/DEAH box helicase [Nitrospirae bacterium]|nr:DEAD/DEAH box helicase [Nitrospirota bacterium]MBF0536325.1 DEAD/DEAH box helicase [Nitrospirota bacterium]MBF0618266.1 DEAD/DEAH box helicase [Nitrospirota bacterium]
MEETAIGNFEQFGLRPEILKGVYEAGFKVPSPIQEQAIPIILSGKDIIARAQTGTGKTAAFGLPAMHAVKHTGSVEVLVMLPTRELASQVSDELYRLGQYFNIRTAAVYGGQSIGRQVDLINRGAQVVAATPGRLLDHLRSNRLKKFAPSIVVLDEADEMLDMGFIEDIESIFEFLPKKRQTMLFSATMPRQIQALARNILTEPVTVDVTPKNLATAADVIHRYYVIGEKEREEALVRLIDTEAPSKSLIFCRTKKETEMLSNTLVSRGYLTRALHGDMEQNQRNEVLAAFRRGQTYILIATDVAARGLDITDVSHVFNYHIPFEPGSYVHRIGRTGRAGKKGIAITLVTPLEFKELKRIMDFSGAPIMCEEIPTISQAKKQYYIDFAKKLMDEEIHEDAVEVFQSLTEDMDATQIACKAISMLLEKKQVAGPNRIGLSTREVADLLQRFRKQKAAFSQKTYKKSPQKRSRRDGL